jgi:hypothetical protein
VAETVIFESDNGRIAKSDCGNYGLSTMGDDPRVAKYKFCCDMAERIAALESQLAAAQPAVEAMKILRQLHEDSNLHIFALCPNGSRWDVIDVIGYDLYDDGESERVVSFGDTPTAALLAAKAHMDKEKGK